MHKDYGGLLKRFQESGKEGKKILLVTVGGTLPHSANTQRLLTPLPDSGELLVNETVNHNCVPARPTLYQLNSISRLCCFLMSDGIPILL